jgi:hypothetical protein
MVACCAARLSTLVGTCNSQETHENVSEILQHSEVQKGLWRSHVVLFVDPH